MFHTPGTRGNRKRLPTSPLMVSNISSLSTVNPQANTVHVVDILRGGDFTWVSGNYANAITNDPAQAIYVPSSVNPSGSSGAWIRQYSGPWNFSWFGGVSDGVLTGNSFANAVTIVSGTNNANAFYNFGVLARYYSTTNNGVQLYMSPGTYLHNYSNCVGFLYGISKFHLYADDVIWQNSYNATVSGANFAYSAPFPPAQSGMSGTGYFINQANVGDTQVVCTTAAQVSNFNVGDYALVGSLDIQFHGGPPNLYQNEFVHIMSTNATSGVITFDTSLRYQHRTDFPDGTGYPGLNTACGKARIWPLTIAATAYAPNGYSQSVSSVWDIDHTYEGITVNLPPGGGQQYVTMSGKRIRTINWIGCGFSESVCGEHISENPTIYTSPETDKNINTITYDRMRIIPGNYFQSDSLDRITFLNSKAEVIQIGGKYFYARNCDIDLLGYNSTYGVTSEVVIENCKVSNCGYMGSVMDSSRVVTIDSSNVWYSNGVFTLKKSGANIGGAFNVPGQHVGLLGTGNLFTGDLGFGVITSLTEDSANLYVGTTLGYTTLPTWCNSNVAIYNVMDVTFKDCSGGNSARQFSQAHAAGYRYFEYQRFVYSGNTAGATSGYNTVTVGKVDTIIVNVLQASVNPATYFQVSLLNSYNGGSNFTLDSYPGVQANIYLTNPGKRIISTNSFIGKQGSDNLTIGGSSVLCLRTNTYINNQYQSYIGGGSLGGAVVEVIIIMDCGQTRRLIPVDSSNTILSYVANVVGTVP